MKHKSLVLKTMAALSLLVYLLGLTACQNKTEKMEKELKEFISAYEAKVKPLSKEAALASWAAMGSGKDADYQKYEELSNKLATLYTNKADFAKLKKIKESKAVKDSLLARQLEVIYLAYLGNQVDSAKLTEVIKLQTEVEKKFNTFRSEVKGKKLSDNEVDDILKTSVNTEELKETWTASKKIGEMVAEDVRKLAKMRNEIAKELGFSNYHEMSLKLSEQDPADINKLFDELDELTRASFASLKGEIDT